MLLVETKIEAEVQTIEKESLQIIPSIKTKYSKIYLSESKSSWITIEWLSEELIQYSTENYHELFSIHPLQKGIIVMYDVECVSPRWHRSYLHQPKREPGKVSYMYSGMERFKVLSLPVPFQKFLDFLNEKEETDKYNQVIANWYANGTDYIAQHSDCLKGMAPNASIAIITLCEDEKFPRELKITPKNLKNETNDNLYTHIKKYQTYQIINTLPFNFSFFT